MPGVPVGVVLELTRFIDSLMSSSTHFPLSSYFFGIELGIFFPLDMCPVILGIYGGALKLTLPLDQKGRSFGTATPLGIGTVMYSVKANKAMTVFGIVVR
jgi:hypothetical protein